MGSRRTLALALSLRAVAASAQPAPPRPPVRWDAATCDGLDLARVRRALAVELGELLLADGDDRPDAVRITLSCSAAAVTLRVAHDASQERVVPWSSLPIAARPRARTVALVAVEMAFAAWVRPPRREPPVAPSGDVARVPLLVPPTIVAPRAEQHPRWSLTPSAALRVLPRGALLGGGGVQFGYELLSGLALALDAQGLEGGGREAITQWDAGLGVGVVTAWQSWRFRLGVGVRAGVAAVDGRSTGWVSPYLRVGASLRLARVLSLDLAGVMGVGVTTASAPIDALEGVWCGLQVGLAFGATDESLSRYRAPSALRSPQEPNR